MDKLMNYLQLNLPDNRNWESLETYARENRVPIMEPLSMHFVLTLLQISKPTYILEVGTAIGYSALRMAEVLPNAKITTLERNKEMAELALHHIHEASCNEQINLIQGDALDTMEQIYLEGNRFDFIFIDAAKGQYNHFFELADKLLHPNGMIVCDNVLFRGFVAGTADPEHKRLKNLGNKLRDFNKALMDNKKYSTSIIPVGDGVSLSVKK